MATRKNGKKLTPAMRAFATFKTKCRNAIIFFRMGDFYEVFFEDAEIVSEVLDLTLTSRTNTNNLVPLVEIPWHVLDGCRKKMLQAGYRVATCEQFESRKTTRDVVCIYTPIRK